MEIHPICQKCLKEHPNWKVTKDGVRLLNDAGRPTIYICRLIKENIDIPDNVAGEFEDGELDILDVLYDSSKWSSMEFNWEPRWYQDYMLKCSAFRKVNRIGRRAGKTETLCVKMLHYAYTNENTTSLVIAPYKNQVGLIFDRIDFFLGSSPAIKSSLKRNTKNPYRVEFHNGSKILGFTSGTRTGSKSVGIRGQDAHAIFLDEADYLGDSDFEAILNKTKDPLVIYTKGGFLSANHQYLTSYKGFVFFAKCSEPINLPSSAEVVQSKRIWIPS